MSRTWYGVFGFLGGLAVGLAGVTGYFILFGLQPTPSVATLPPVELAPRRPDGVTVLPKKEDRLTTANDAPPPPQAAGALVAHGYAIDLGAAESFSDLSARFAEIAANNAEIPFEKWEPRATLKDTERGLEARLMVGPFETLREAAQVCNSIALPAQIQCRAGPFEGELISRE